MIIFMRNESAESDVPFVRTHSYRVLMYWIYKMGIDITDMLVCDMKDFKMDYKGRLVLRTGEYTNTEVELDRYTFVSLGSSAAHFLNELGVNNFCLPDPAVIDAEEEVEFIDKKLVECKKWLEDCNE